MKLHNNIPLFCLALALSYGTVSADWAIKFYDQERQIIPEQFTPESFHAVVQGQENMIQELDIFDSNLNLAPSSLENLTYLRELFLSKETEQLPASLANLTYLRRIHLGGDHITLPCGIEATSYDDGETQELQARLRPLHLALQSAVGYATWSEITQKEFRDTLDTKINEKLAELKEDAEFRLENENKRDPVLDVTEETVIRLHGHNNDDKQIHNYLLNNTPARLPGSRTKGWR